MERAVPRNQVSARQLGPLRVAVFGSRPSTLEPLVRPLKGRPLSRLPAGSARELLTDISFLQMWRAAIAIGLAVAAAYVAQHWFTGWLSTALTVMIVSAL